VVNGPEVCDDGTNNGTYGTCMPGCLKLAPRCGDGVVNGSEVCDDGTNSGVNGTCMPGCTAAGGCDPAQGRVSSPFGGCVTCSNPCNQEGETGEYHPTATRSNQCVCVTKPGYFRSNAGGIGTYPCDRDGDGWVRDSAKPSIESTDPPISTNARCALRKATSVVLKNDDGDELPVYFTQGASPDATVDPTLGGGALPLYESDRNDDPSLLGTKVPDYGASSGTRRLSVQELNSFTKACVNLDADHNDNGQPDIAEWARLPGSQINVTPQGGGRDAFRQLYARFSYFVELHEAWFDETAVDTDGKSRLGRYIIREKYRAPGGNPPHNDQFGLAYGQESPGGPYTSDFWQFCSRGRDTTYSPALEAVTFDFASVSGPELNPKKPGWRGMMAHSQFKCVHVVTHDVYNAMSAVDRQSKFHRQTAESIVANDWQPNRCVVNKPAFANSHGTGQPSNVPVLCTPDYTTPNPDTVLWAAVRIQEDPLQYKRGCLVQCPGSPFLCEGTAPGATKPCHFMCADFSGSYPARVGATTGQGFSVQGEISSQIWGASEPLHGGGYSLQVLGVPIVEP
jgi:hypothetical protein